MNIDWLLSTRYNRSKTYCFYLILRIALGAHSGPGRGQKAFYLGDYLGDYFGDYFGDMYF